MTSFDNDDEERVLHAFDDVDARLDAYDEPLLEVDEKRLAILGGPAAPRHVACEAQGIPSVPPRDISAEHSRSRVTATTKLPASLKSLTRSLGREGADLRVRVRRAQTGESILDPGDDPERHWALIGQGPYERQVELVLPILRPRTLEILTTPWRPWGPSPPLRNQHQGACRQIVPAGTHGRVSSSIDRALWPKITKLAAPAGSGTRARASLCGHYVAKEKGFFLEGRPEDHQVACAGCAERMFPGVREAADRRDRREEIYDETHEARDLGLGLVSGGKRSVLTGDFRLECRCSAWTAESGCEHVKAVHLRDRVGREIPSLETTRRRMFGADAEADRAELRLRNVVAVKSRTVELLGRAAAYLTETSQAIEAKRVRELGDKIDKCGHSRKTASCANCGIRVVGPPTFICGVRLCSLCARHRTRELVERVTAVVMRTGAKLSELSLWTLTIENVPRLTPAVLRRLHLYFQRLVALVNWQRPGAIRGAFRALETTWRPVKNADGTWHIHIHAIVWHAEKIPQSLVSDLWWLASDAHGYYAHMKRVRARGSRAGPTAVGGAAAEASKGAADPGNLAGVGELEETVEEVTDYVTKRERLDDPLALVELERSMYRVRMAEFIGEWREADLAIRKEEEKGDADEVPGPEADAVGKIDEALANPELRIGDHLGPDLECPACGTAGTLWRDEDTWVGYRKLCDVLARGPGDPAVTIETRGSRRHPPVEALPPSNGTDDDPFPDTGPIAHPVRIIDAYDPRYRLIPELIPSPLWRQNVREQFPTDWSRLQQDQFHRAGGKCEICGNRGSRYRRDDPLQCHEVWRYNDVLGVQRLERLIALCPDCHHAKHAGYWGRVKGHMNEVLGQLVRVNGISEEDALALLDAHMDLWERRSSRRDWVVDMGALTELGVQRECFDAFVFTTKKWR